MYSNLTFGSISQTLVVSVVGFRAVRTFFSKRSVPVFSLRKPINTCDFPGRVRTHYPLLIRPCQLKLKPTTVTTKNKGLMHVANVALYRPILQIVNNVSIYLTARMYSFTTANIQSRVTIGPPAKRHFNGVSLADR